MDGEVMEALPQPRPHRLPPPLTLVEEPTLSAYEEVLDGLLRRSPPLTDDELEALRAIVRERRGRHPRQTQATPAVHDRADAIVELLDRAARQLRPRETQQLDDLVAGKLPEPSVTHRHPIRSHRNGRPVS
jgi:hypothetical protein